MIHDAPAHTIPLDAQPAVPVTVRPDSSGKSGTAISLARNRNPLDAVCAVGAMLSLIASATLFFYCLHLVFHISGGGARYIGINTILLCHKLAFFCLTIAGGFYFLRESAALSELSWLRPWLLSIALAAASFWLMLRLGFVDNHDCIFRA